MKVYQTLEFTNWLNKQDRMTYLRVESRLSRVAIGHYGFHKKFSDLIELKWTCGIRVYCFEWQDLIIIALYGGNKNGQIRDIQEALKIRQECLSGAYTFPK